MAQSDAGQKHGNWAPEHGMGQKSDTGQKNSRRAPEHGIRQDARQKTSKQVPGDGMAEREPVDRKDQRVCGDVKQNKAVMS